MAVRDEGSCSSLISLHVYYYVCPPTVNSLAAYRLTPAGPHLLPVGGACVSHAHLAGLTPPTQLCTSTGVWYVQAGGACQCDAGYRPNNDSTRCVAGSLSVCLSVTISFTSRPRREFDERHVTAVRPINRAAGCKGNENNVEL